MDDDGELSLLESSAPEILTVIFSFLSTGDLVTLSQTSKTLAYASQDPYVLTQLKAPVAPRKWWDCSALVSYLSVRTSIRALDLSSMRITNGILGTLTLLPRLRTLILDHALGFSAFHDPGYEIDPPVSPSVEAALPGYRPMGIVELVGALPELHTLSLHRTRGLHCEFALLLAAGGGVLSSITVSSTPGTTFTSPPDPAHAGALTHLALPACRRLSSEGLWSILAAAPRLQSLNVARTFIRGAAFENLPESACSQIHTLVMSGCMQVRDEDFAAIVAALPSLTDLDASYNHLTSDALVSLADSHGSCLASLALRKTSRMKPQGLGSLSSLLGPALTSLDLSFLRALDAPTLTEALASAKNLGSLKLYGAPDISPELGEVIAHLPRLHTLSVRQLAFDDDILSTVLVNGRALRDLTVIDCGGVTGAAFEDLSGVPDNKLETVSVFHVHGDLDHNSGMVSALGRYCTNLTGLAINGPVSRFSLGKGAKWNVSCLRDIRIGRRKGSSGDRMDGDGDGWMLASLAPLYVDAVTSLAFPRLHLFSPDVLGLLSQIDTRFLHTLDLFETHVDGELVPFLFTSLDALTTLSLCGCANIEDTALDAVVASRSSSITSLDLTDAVQIGASFVTSVSSLCPSLTSLQLGGTSVPSSLQISSLFPLVMISSVSTWL